MIGIKTAKLRPSIHVAVVLLSLVLCCARIPSNWMIKCTDDQPDRHGSATFAAALVVTKRQIIRYVRGPFVGDATKTTRTFAHSPSPRDNSLYCGEYGA